MIKNYEVKSTIFEINKTKGTKIGAIIMDNKRKRLNKSILKNSLPKPTITEEKKEFIPKVIQETNNFKGFYL